MKKCGSELCALAKHRSNSADLGREISFSDVYPTTSRDITLSPRVMSRDVSGTESTRVSLKGNGGYSTQKIHTSIYRDQNV